MTVLVAAIVVAVYLGMAFGRWPGLKVDRAGIALLGALAVYGAGVMDGAAVLAAIDFPTLLILFGLMILSAQFAACGFYDWLAARLAGSSASPVRLLALVVASGGVLSAVLANDVVVFAVTPLLCSGLIERRLDPRPFVIALACAANAGSAATLIGNPQNVLIGQLGQLDFWRFIAVCAVPAVLSLGVVQLTVWAIWRRAFHLSRVPETLSRPAAVALDRAGVAKGVAATLLLLGLLALEVPQAESVLLVAAVLLVSRRLATRTVLTLVDWHLLVLFAGLFVVTGGLAASGLIDSAVARLGGFAALSTFWSLAPLATLGSNTIGNVPFVMLYLAGAPPLPAESLYALSLFTTLAGNLLLVGSFANLIAAERAASVGVVVGFWDHARCGVPITLFSLAIAGGWLILIAPNG